MPITTPQVLERLGRFKDELRPFTVVTVPFPKKEVNQLWKGFFVMPYAEKLNDLHGRPMVNVVSGETFFIHDKHSSTLRKSPGWLCLKTMEDEINQILSRTESKFSARNGGVCTSKTIGLLARRHIHSGEFHYIGREASTRWASGPDLPMMTDAGILDPTHETFRECERILDPKYLDEIRAEAKEFTTKLLSRKSRVAECAIRNFKNGKNTIKPGTLRKLRKAIRDLQNKKLDPQLSVNEFYKKGCQEKSSSSTGGREDFCLEIQPTDCKCPSIALEGFGSGLSALPVGFIFPWWRRQSSLETWQADLVLECQPWFYRRLVAYRYFWLSEEA